MGRFIIIRLLQTIVAIFGIALFIFILVRLSGDPTDLMRGPTTTEEEVANMKQLFGLDKPQAEQFALYIKSFITGNLGISIIKRRPVAEMLGEAWLNSLKLGLSAFIIGMLIALILGIIASIKRDSLTDNFVKLLAILGQAVPGFWLAIVCIFIFSVYFKLLPTSGLGGLSHYVMPVGTLSFFLLPGMMRLVRSSMLDVLDSEYIKLARIKGLSEHKVIWKHALRNASITPLTVAGMLFVQLIMGSVVTESVFNWPGVGRLLIDGVVARDFPVVQSIVIIYASVVLLVNLLVDITYAFVDPQIRYQSI